MMLLIELPAEIIALILGHCDPRDVASAARACKALCAVARTDATWRSVAQRLFPCERFCRCAVPLTFREYFRLKLALLGPEAQPLAFARVAVRNRGLHSGVPTPRFKHSAAAIFGGGGRQLLAVVGGQRSHSHRYDTVHTYDPVTQLWTQLTFDGASSSSAPPKFARMAATELGSSRLFLHGGYDGVSSYFDVQIFDAAEGTWRVVNTPEPRPCIRTNHTAVVVEGGRAVLVWGGITTSQLIDVGDLWRFDVASETWTELPQKGDVPAPRCGHTMWTFGDRVFLFGGGAKEGWEDKFEQLHSYCVETNEWSLVPTTGTIEPLIFPYSCKAGPFMFFFAGIGPGALETVQNKLFVLDLVSLHWTQLEYSKEHHSLARERSMGTATLLGNTIYFFGGSDNWVQPLIDFESLQLPFPPELLQRGARS